MPARSELLADLLGQVCRHLGLVAAAPELAAALGRWLPVRGLLFRRLSREPACVETVAVAGPGVPGERTALSGPRIAGVLAFLEAGRPASWRSRTEVPLGRVLVPEAVEGPVAVLPLGGSSWPFGVAILAGSPPPEVLEALIGPLEAAVDNDLRLRELERLRARAGPAPVGPTRQDVSEAIVGAGSGLREAMVRVAQVARTDAPVLILGETGTGKEVVAREIHDRSGRAARPFLRVNCGAIPPDLVDSELFGHEKGSFTGAIARREGWFERADGGTLFLDEVAELSPAAQVRLLRVLQDGTFERVGGNRVHAADVRIIAATHRDMGRMVAEGRFREDLWYRICVFPIRLPSLRDRLDDVPMLARHFAERAGTRLFGRPLAPDAQDLAALRSRAWPGNVRELMAVVERAAILGGGERLDVAAAMEAPRPPEPVSDRAAIEEALSRCRGRIEGPFGAAEALGVNPHTLRSRMRRLGIDWARYRTPRA